MPTDVVMPQMGESIFEGTLTKWLKKPGEKVQRDEPLFEISTDKVDAEIPAPASGVLKEIKVSEGATVQVNTVVGVIDADGAGAAAPAPAKPEAARPAAPAKPAARAAGSTRGGAASTEGPPPPPPAPVPQAEGTSRARQPQSTEAAARGGDGARGEPALKEVIEFHAPEHEDEARRIRSSPLVRRIAREYNVDLARVTGSGLGGRITKEDIQEFIAQQGADASAPSRVATAAQPVARAAAAPTMPAPGEIVPMSTMRKKIAEHMVASKRTSAHVHSVFEIDMTRIVRLREKERAAFEQRTGAKLTFMPFFARAVIAGLRQFPVVNSSVEGDNIHYHRNINLGIAVALDWGLIVPVVKRAEELNFLGLQRSITDLAERARNKKLSPDDVQGGTFTITNPGIYGPLFGLPIINQPQVAILGIGGIFKTPIVKTDPEGNDYIAIAPMMRISLGYDHRVIDGAIADQFLAVVKKKLEQWDEEIG
jgi:2-oxoglutarate dehydrogenase E2 component (dihydrolipoamide succinyltransferase)